MYEMECRHAAVQRGKQECQKKSVVYEMECRHAAVQRGKQDQNHLY